MLTTWMGDMITDRGIGNGVSIIIFAGIIARMPTSIYQIYQEQFVNVSQSDWWKSGLFVVGLALLVIIIVMFVTWVEQANDRIQFNILAVQLVHLTVVTYH